MFPCADRQFSIAVKECDEIYHLGINGCLEFIALLQCLCVLEDKSCGRESFSQEVNFLLKPYNSAIKVFKFSSFLNYRVDRSYSTLPFIHPRLGSRAWRSLDRIVHPIIS